MIPKVIHFCWFGGKPLSHEAKRYIKTWKKKLPDYRIVKWNERNFDIKSAPVYVQEAYNLKKYAFVADYVRVRKLSDYGGVYFDTDIEVIEDFSKYLEGKNTVLGFESERTLTTAFIACRKQDSFISEFAHIYEQLRFVKENGEMDLTSINTRLSQFAEKKGVNLDRNEYQEIDGGIAIYPSDYFAAWDIYNWHPVRTERTCTIHHMAASWVSVKQKLKIVIIRFLQRIIGEKGYDDLRARVKGIKSE